MIKLPYGWDSAVQAAKRVRQSGIGCNMQIAPDIILELDSQLRSPAQTKTIADAVGRCNHEWVSAENEYVKGASICTKCKTIADTATVEQESEKWTHTIDGLKVRFLVDGPDESGEVPVVADDGYYRIFDVDQLKPIKPTISESEAIGILMANKHLSFAALLEDYDVVKD